MTDPLDGRSMLKPTDVLILGWIGWKHACVDLTKVSPLIGMGDDVFTVGHTALEDASYKVSKQEKTCMTIQHMFIHFMFENFGFFAPDAVELLIGVQ